MQTCTSHSTEATVKINYANAKSFLLNVILLNIGVFYYIAVTAFL